MAGLTKTRPAARTSYRNGVAAKMANLSSSGSSRSIPVPVIVAVVALLVLLVGFVAYRALSPSGPAGQSDWTNMSVQERLNHMRQVESEQPKGPRRQLPGGGQAGGADTGGPGAGGADSAAPQTR